MPAGDGQAYRVQCVVNGGVDADGQVITAQTFTAVVGVLASSGYVPLASGEETDRSATHGWTPDLNGMINAAIAAGGYTPPSGGVANRITYSTAGDSNQWATEVWSDGTYLAIGGSGDVPTSGSLRLELGATGTVKSGAGTAATWLNTWNPGGVQTDIQFATSSFRYNILGAGTAVRFYINGAYPAIVGDGYVGIGSTTLPTSGQLRLADSFYVRAYCGDDATGATIITWADPELVIGDAADIDELTIASAANTYLTVNTNDRLTVNATGTTVATGTELVITGVNVRSSAETMESLSHAKIATDAGADGAPVAVVTYTLPEDYRATLKCKVVGENASQVPVVDAEWTIKVYRNTAGNVTEYSAAVAPAGDPALAGVSITYGLSGGVVTLYKQNTSASALTFSGEIVVARAQLIG